MLTLPTLHYKGLGIRQLVFAPANVIHQERLATRFTADVMQ